MIELFIHGIISLAFMSLASSSLLLFRFSRTIPFHHSHLPFQILHFIYLVPSTYCRFLQFSIRFRVAYFMSRRLRVPPLFSRRSRLDVIVMKQMRWHTRARKFLAYLAWKSCIDPCNLNKAGTVAKNFCSLLYIR